MRQPGARFMCRGLLFCPPKNPRQKGIAAATDFSLLANGGLAAAQNEFLNLTGGSFGEFRKKVEPLGHLAAR
jgi:hypothetical protein